jgi:hypothetical protein
MNLKIGALMVSVMGLAFLAGLERLALPEALSLAVWGMGLLAAGASVRGLPRAAVESGRAETVRGFTPRTAKLAA